MDVFFSEHSIDYSRVAPVWSKVIRRKKSTRSIIMRNHHRDRSNSSSKVLTILTLHDQKCISPNLRPCDIQTPGKYTHFKTVFTIWSTIIPRIPSACRTSVCSFSFLLSVRPVSVMQETRHPASVSLMHQTRPLQTNKIKGHSFIRKPLSTHSTHYPHLYHRGCVAARQLYTVRSAKKPSFL